MEKLGDLVKKYIDLRDEIDREDLEKTADEYMSLEEFIRDLEIENSTLSKKLETNIYYVDTQKKVIDTFEYAASEQEVIINEAEVARINEEIEKLQTELLRAQGDMSELDVLENDLNEELHQLDARAMIGSTNLKSNKKDLNSVRRDLSFLQKMQGNEQETINKLNEKINELKSEKEQRTNAINNSKEKMEAIKNRQEQPNGYDKVHEKEADKALLNQNTTLIEQSRNRLTEINTDLSRDKNKEAEGLQTQINNYSQDERRDRRVTALRKLANPAVAIGQFAKFVFNKVKDFLVKVWENRDYASYEMTQAYLAKERALQEEILPTAHIEEDELGMPTAHTEEVEDELGMPRSR